MPAPREDLARYAADHGLKQLGGRPALFAYVKELWVRRHFALELAKSRVRSQNEQDRLGIGWVVLTPLINAAVYGFIFGVLLKSSGRPPHFVPFLICGVFTFAFFSGCFSDGARSIIGNRGLVRTLHFPRAVLPIATVLQKLLELGAQVVVMCAIVTASGEIPTWRWLMIVPVFAMMAMFCAGIAFFAARLTIHVRDIAQLIPFITRLIFYVSGIFFAISTKFIDRSVQFLGQSLDVASLLQLNPVNVYITLVRDSLLTRDREVPGVGAEAFTWELGLGWAVVMFVGGFLFFWRAEGLYGRE
jgi:teichoic acid transport system permease protein